MSLMAVCQKIKNHMRTVYKINQHDHDMVNLVTCRAIVLTRFHLILTNHSRDSLLAPVAMIRWRDCYTRQVKNVLLIPYLFPLSLLFTFWKTLSMTPVRNATINFLKLRNQ